MSEKRVFILKLEQVEFDPLLGWKYSVLPTEQEMLFALAEVLRKFHPSRYLAFHHLLLHVVTSSEIVANTASDRTQVEAVLKKEFIRLETWGHKQQWGTIKNHIQIWDKV